MVVSFRVNSRPRVGAHGELTNNAESSFARIIYQFSFLRWGFKHPSILFAPMVVLENEHNQCPHPYICQFCRVFKPPQIHYKSQVLQDIWKQKFIQKLLYTRFLTKRVPFFISTSTNVTNGGSTWPFPAGQFNSGLLERKTVSWALYSFPGSFIIGGVQILHVLDFLPLWFSIPENFYFPSPHPLDTAHEKSDVFMFQ